MARPRRRLHRRRIGISPTRRRGWANLDRQWHVELEHEQLVCPSERTVGLGAALEWGRCLPDAERWQRSGGEFRFGVLAAFGAAVADDRRDEHGDDDVLA